MTRTTLVSAATLQLLVFLGTALADDYVVPPADVKALVPKGFSVSIPDSPGITLFAFHGHLNKPIADLEAGTFSQDVLRTKNGRWTYVNTRVQVRAGDKLYYWLYVQLDGKGYRLDDQVSTIEAPASSGSNTRPTGSAPVHGDVNGHHRPNVVHNAQCPPRTDPPGKKPRCNPTITTVGGSRAPSQVCAGALLFEDNFDELDLEKWQHEITMSGGGNWEFQVYSNNRSNSWVEGGNLHIKPTLTIDQYGPDFLSSGTINLHGGAPADACTNPSFYGCERTGNAVNILNPAKSARVRTLNSFHFKYGRVEVRAKMPLGDWLWPAIWMMPRYNKYGTWPTSGEIDISEVRSNANLQLDGVNIGVEQTGSTLHYGPYWPLNGFNNAHFSVNRVPGFDSAFHVYGLEWTDTLIRFSLDGAVIGTVTPPAGGFWEHGGFAGQAPQAENPWRTGGHMAPFDQHFYIILNLAVGGTNSYFPDNAVNNPPKPWLNTSPQAFLDFWNGRSQWYPTWNSDGSTQSHLQVDYVRVWAI